MADATQFDHDRVGHLLADRLLAVPSFQRSYAWDEGNVEDFLSDLAVARKKDASYFLGTVVFALVDGDARQQIVDGQQRLATTAVLLIAIRDLLRDYKKEEAARHIDETYLRGYDLETEVHVERLTLNPDDQPEYERLLARTPLDGSRSPLAESYRLCMEHLVGLAPTAAGYRALIEVTSQLEDGAQVLVAVASDLPEAYVIFETLNDRGADLTTADLLKNFLFSQSGEKFAVVQKTWIEISAAFEKADDLVKFIRHEYMSRNGHVTTRNLYQALQGDIGAGATMAMGYVLKLNETLPTYQALRDPDASFWGKVAFDTRDTVLAFRRFGFESSLPLLLAAFENWTPDKAARLFVKVVGWSLRALFAGKLGGSVAEKAFSDAAKKVTAGTATTQDAARTALATVLVDDADFKRSFQNFGNVTLTRAKYLLASLERAQREKDGESVEGLPDWSSRTVTLEHLHARSAAKNDEVAGAFVETLGNMALLEKSLNRAAEDKPFNDKKGSYAASAFLLTVPLSAAATWGAEEVSTRASQLAELAIRAWPAT
jgi:hypothetical protein